MMTKVSNLALAFLLASAQLLSTQATEKVRYEKFGWYEGDDLAKVPASDKHKCFPGGKPIKVEFPIDKDSAYCLRTYSNSVSVKNYNVF